MKIISWNIPVPKLNTKHAFRLVRDKSRFYEVCFINCFDFLFI